MPPRCRCCISGSRSERNTREPLAACLPAENGLQHLDRSLTRSSGASANIVCQFVKGLGIGDSRSSWGRPNMSPCDFLHKDAQTPLSEHYTVAGAVCHLSTNSRDLLEAAYGSFLPVERTPLSVDFSVRLWVDPSDVTQPPWPKPYVRGLDHLVFAGFSAGSSLVADLRRRRVIGRCSPAMAADATYWKRVIFPMVLTIVGPSVGIAELHCACVTNDQGGVFLVGPSGSGKSTLALALAKIGFGLLSDDRTFCSLKNGEVLGWGLQTRIKLRPETAIWFQELRTEQLTDSHGGEPAFWLDPEGLNLKRARFCRPSSLIFLERQQAPQFSISRMSSVEALGRLNTDLTTELPDAVARRSEAVARLVEFPCWLLRSGGDPHTVARNILQHVARQ